MQFLCAVPAIDLFRGCDLNNKVHLEFLSKEAKVRLHLTKRLSYWLYITNKTERFSFISGCVVLVVEHSKQDWLIMLR